MNILQFINITSDKNTNNFNFDLLTKYNNLQCKLKNIYNIKNKYHSVYHTGLIDKSGIEKYRQFMDLFTGQNINNVTKSYKNIHTYIIHIPKYTDRKENMLKLMEKLEINNYTFITPFPPTEETRYKLGVFLGCDLSKSKISLTQMSHSLTYYRILQRTDYDDILILEDDANLINSLEDTKIIFDHIINNYPEDSDSIFLEYCSETCNKNFKDFNRLVKPYCTAAIYYPSISKRIHILNEIKKFCQKNGNRATDNIIATLISTGNIISYEHELIFFQDKNYGSYIEGSSKDVVPFCDNMKSNSKKLIPNINYQQSNTLNNSKNIYLYILLILSIVVFGLIVYKLNR